VSGRRILSGDDPDDADDGDDREEQVVEPLVEGERLRHPRLLLARPERRAPLRRRPEECLEHEDVDVEYRGERREDETGDDHACSRHECFGS
jgi:hypothetical protein